MEYSKLFSTDAEHIEYINSAEYKEPYVSYTETDGHAHYNYNIALDNNFLRFTAVSDTASICLNSLRNHVSSPVSIKYSKTGTIDSWQNMSTMPISLSKGETIYLMGSNPNGVYDYTLKVFDEFTLDTDNVYGISFFDMTGLLMGGGNIMSIVDTSEENNFLVADEIPIPSDYDEYQGYFMGFFIGNDSLLKAPELNVSVIPDSGCTAMYADCTLLLIVPEYNFTSVGLLGCQAMFYNCSKLLNFLSLPATTLSNGAYVYMFGSCTSLKNIPNILPATTLPEYDGIKCTYGVYYSMFYKCTSLTTAPALPAETLEDYCYDSMFFECTSLTTAPALPSTSLAVACYHNMFTLCTSLTTAPALPANSLETLCYYGMFLGCTSLVNVPEELGGTLASACYELMFEGCTSLTETPILSNTNIATAATTNCYKQMFMGCSSLTTVTCLGILNWRTYYLSSSTGQTLMEGWHRTLHTVEWLKDVPENGTIYMSANVGVWCNTSAFKQGQAEEIAVIPQFTTYGANSIPSSWTVETYQA